MRKVKLVVEKTTTGYSAYAEKYPVYTTGKDLTDLVNHIVEALNFYFQETGNQDLVISKDLRLSFSITNPG